MTLRLFADSQLKFSNIFESKDAVITANKFLGIKTTGY